MAKQEKHKEYAHFDDNQLWKSFKGGDRGAYAYIYQKYVRLLFIYGSKISKDRDLVKDCIQELFLYLWQRKETLGETNNINYYLFKSVRRHIIDKLKKVNSYAGAEEISPDYNFIVVSSCIEDVIKDQSSKEYRERLTQALDKLTGRQKEAIFLKYYHNLNFEEIASIMSINKRSVYKLVHKAIDALKRTLLLTTLSLFLLVSFISLFR